MKIEALAQWSEPRKVTTKQGNRILRTATPGSDFWNVWRSGKEALKAAGISVSRNDAGEYQVCWWMADRVADETAAASIEASRALDSDIEIPCPEGLAYLPYQKGGIAYASQRPATLIADEMGLGKTIQAIGVINLDPEIKTALVICPASLKINWQRELNKWLTRPFTVGVANGAFPDTDIAVVNYDILTKHMDAILSRSWDCMIVDECHYIKNPKAKRTGLVLSIPARQAIRRQLFLTGTPICNRPAELWTLARAIDPTGLGRTWRGFHMRYTGAYQTSYGWDVSGATNLDELQDRLRSKFMIRRLKKDVLTELPPKRRVVRELPRLGSAKVIEACDRRLREDQDTQEVLAAGIELARAAGDKDAYEKAIGNLRAFLHAAFTERSKIRHEMAVAKIPAVVDYLKNILVDSDEQLVVFAHHIAVVDGIMAGLADAGISAVQLTGSSSQKDRQDAVDGFQAGKYQVFVGNIHAAGVGITLTASAHVLFAEMDDVPGTMTQAEDRCHRIGQTESVLVEHLVLDGTLDVNMAQGLIEKQTVIDQALDINAGPKEIAEPVLDVEVEPVQRVRVSMREYSVAETTPEQKAAAHEAMRIVAAMDEDHAQYLNGIGFSRYDNSIGHALAKAAELTDRQAALASKLARKYHKQLPAELLAAIEGK